MKKLFSFLMILGVMAMGFDAVAQDEQATDTTAAMADTTAVAEDPFPEDKVRGPERHPDRKHGKNWHGHVGPVNHIPVNVEEK